MRATAARGEWVAAGGLLLLCGLSCFCLTDATSALELANGRRCDMMRELAQQLVHPDLHSDGPIAALDGLFARGLVRETTPTGTSIAFADLPPGGNP